MLAESEENASMDSDSRSGAGTEIQRAFRGYAGAFLEHMDKLPMDQAMSGSKLTTLLQSYLSAPKTMSGALAESIVDRLPHDGDKLLLGDHSSCGEQSVEDLF